MRSCIYCGRDLKDGEVCSCAEARAKNTANTSNENNNEYYNNNSYTTGYTKKENPIKRSWQKHRTKASARRNTYNSKAARQFGNSLWGQIKRFAISPVDTVTNPGYISKATAVVLSLICGAVINVCLYFIRTGAVRSPFGIIFSLIALNPIHGYSNLLYIAMSAVSGAVMGIIFFFIYTGVFYFIDRFVFRFRSGFWSFAPSLALTAIPLALASIIGILLGMLSSTSLAILVICGIIGMVVLTYEALKTAWLSASSGKVVYAMMVGFFVIASIICYIIRLS